jgi:hypothetical protein
MTLAIPHKIQLIMLHKSLSHLFRYCKRLQHVHKFILYPSSSQFHSEKERRKLSRNIYLKKSQTMGIFYLGKNYFKAFYHKFENFFSFTLSVFFSHLPFYAEISKRKKKREISFFIIIKIILRFLQLKLRIKRISFFFWRHLEANK